MTQSDCSRFESAQRDVEKDRDKLKDRKRNAEFRLEEIDERQGEILREIATIGLTLPPMRFRPRRRQRRQLFDDFDDAQTFMSAENARRKVRILESDSMALRAEAQQHEAMIERFDRQMDELRREELMNRDLAREAGC
jgi:hypothetical protein